MDQSDEEIVKNTAWKVSYVFNDTWNYQTQVVDRLPSFEVALKRAEELLKEKFPNATPEIIKDTSARDNDKASEHDIFGLVRLGYHSWEVKYDPTWIPGWY